MIKILLLFLLFLNTLNSVKAINNNPIISRGKTVVTSAGNAPYLVDNKFSSASTFKVSDGAWVAINVGEGPSQVFFSWNNPNYTWSDVIAKPASDCGQQLVVPEDYEILTSSNSTNGEDGTWTTALSVTGNLVSSRGHLIDFTNQNWIKFNIVSGGGTLDEVEVFDASDDSNDIWFFAGTSISANTYKGSVPEKNYADLITQSFPDYNPAMVRGGIPCITSSDLVRDLDKYIALTRDVKYWAIEMGTNDAWGGTNGGVTTFKNNLQKIIEACKQAGIQPVIAKILATGPGSTWQVHPDYLTAIDDLTKTNDLIEGPDLYTWFIENPTDLNTDGVHPNDKGAASIQRLWAEKMAPLYETVTAVQKTGLKPIDINIFPHPASKDEFTISSPIALNNCTLEILDLQGKMVFSKRMTGLKENINSGLKPGAYVLKITGNDIFYNDTLIIK